MRESVLPPGFLRSDYLADEQAQPVNSAGRHGLTAATRLPYHHFRNGTCLSIARDHRKAFALTFEDKVDHPKVIAQ